MKKLLDNLKDAIKHYEDCVDVCAAEHIMAESLRTLNKCCKEVSEECEVRYNTMLDDD